MENKFKYFLHSLETSTNKSLIESISSAYDLIFESHKGFTRTVESIAERFSLPAKDWPEYVKKEIYRGLEHLLFDKSNLKDIMSPEQRSQIEQKKETFKNTDTWKKLEFLNVNYENPKIIEVSLSDFNDTSTVYSSQPTKTSLTQRISSALGGNSMVQGVPRDKERHEKQAELLKSTGGINREPVIMVQSSDGSLILQEGWHRMLQMIVQSIEPKIQSKMNEVWGEERVKAADQESLKIMRQDALRKIDINDIKFKVNAYVGKPAPSENIWKKLLSIFKN